MNFRRTLASNIAAAAFALSAAQGVSAQTPPEPQPSASQAAGTRVVAKDSYREFNPYFHPAVLGGMGALYAALCLLAWRRGMKGNTLRAFAGAAALYAMANHQDITKISEKLPTETFIVVDKSPSQSLGVRTKSTEDAKTTLHKALKEIPGVNVNIIEVGGGKDGIAADGTRILDSIDDALRDVPLTRRGGVFILTDGQIHDPIGNHHSFGENVPAHALISGKQNEYDRRIEIEEVSRFGIIQKKQDIKFRVLDEGSMPKTDAQVRVSIHQDGKLVSSQMAIPGQTATVSVDISHAGQNIFEIKTGEVNGEVTTVNNRAMASIEGIHEKLSVLIISGSPNPNTRMWRNLLKSDPDVDMVHFMAQRYPEQLDDTPREELSLLPFPMNEVFSENLSKFNLVIFDGFDNRRLLANTYLENIVKYVKNGGALLVASGPEYIGQGSIYHTPLGAILPAAPADQITERAFIPRISDRGQRHPVTRGLEGANTPKDSTSQPSWGAWFRSVDIKSPAGEVVMEGADKKPLLILNHHEKGRVAMLNSDSLWRWARSFDSKGPYSSLLLQTSHWLMKKPALEEEALKIIQQGKDLVIEQQTMADKSTPVTVQTPSGKSISLTPETHEPGLWRARVRAEEMGIYSVEQVGKNPRIAFVNVGPENAQEFVHTVSTPDILKPLVKRTGGVITYMTDQTNAQTIPGLHALSADDKDKVAAPDQMGVRMTRDSILRNIEKKQVIDNRILALIMLLSMAGAYIHQSGTNPFKRRQPSPDGPKL